MRRILSYIWPITQKVSSQVNGTLEITWINGRKVLDSQNANYSYGHLQKILEVGLSKLDFGRIESVLVLGLGGGSVVASLLDKFHFKGSIVGVEIDKTMIDIAEKEFKIINSDHLRIVQCDAMEYVLQVKESYELVIVDLFIDNCVPPQFYSKYFCDNLRGIIGEYGYLLFNLGLDKVRTEECNQVIRYFQEHPYFTCHLLDSVLGYNLILLAERVDSDKQPFSMSEIPKI